MNEREIALEKVNMALPVYERINELYFAANSLNQRAMAARADEERVRQNMKKRHKTDWKNMDYGRFFIGFIILIPLMVAVDSTVKKMPSFVSALLKIAIIIGGAMLYLKRKERIKNKHEQTEAQINTMMPQMESISREIYRVTTENQEKINLMPRDYRYYDAVVFFESALANGRADSMKEAINLYEETIHRQNMELHGRQMLEQCRMQSAMLANIEQYSKEAAINSGIAASFSVLNYL
ncbi:MAG: hypothetical protein SO072_07920 [Dysosmobacter sp.]|nr:hypothetical protein [Dysosmobacter sp.]